MRPWATITALLTGVYAFGFFVHERPPTSGHVVAGVMIGIPAILLVAAMLGLPPSDKANRGIFLIQTIATTTAAAAELSQHLALPIVLRVLPILILAIPVLGAARAMRQPVTVASTIPTADEPPMSAVVMHLQALPTRFLVLLLLAVILTAVAAGQDLAAGLDCIASRGDFQLGACLIPMLAAAMRPADIAAVLGYFAIVALVLMWPGSLQSLRRTAEENRIQRDGQPPLGG